MIGYQNVVLLIKVTLSALRSWLYISVGIWSSLTGWHVVKTSKAPAPRRNEWHFNLPYRLRRLSLCFRQRRFVWFRFKHTNNKHATGASRMCVDSLLWTFTADLTLTEMSMYQWRFLNSDTLDDTLTCALNFKGNKIYIIRFFIC